MDKCLAVDLKDPGLTPIQGDFFHLNEPKGEGQEQQQQQVSTNTGPRPAA